MRLKTVYVNDLFGIYKYEINMIDSGRSKVTIIDAPNGMGKTTMLRLIKATVEGNILFLDSIPFSEFKITFDNGKSITVNKENVYSSILDSTITTIRRDEDVRRGSVRPIDDDRVEYSNIKFSINRKKYKVAISRDFLRMLLRSRRILSYANHDQVQLRDVIDEREYTSEDIFSADDLLLALSKLRKEINIYFIEANRLFKRNDDDVNERDRMRAVRGEYRENMVSAVGLYRGRIQKYILSAGKEFADKSEELDRSFPQRVLDVIFDKNRESVILSKEQIVAALEDLEERRLKFGELGLITNTKDSMISIPKKKDLTDETRIFLTKYIDDNIAKLEVYSELFEKLDILRNIVNTRNVFSDKEMRFSSKEGIVFVSKSGRTIPIEKLSSGEKNNFILFYELIFECKDNSLILVDEPEISLHVAWQNQYISELNDICEIKNLQGIVATHSPDIVGEYEDCMVDLEDLNNG